MKKILFVLFVSLAITVARAGNPPTAATIISENSVTCGTKAHGHHHKEEQDLTCQEYVVRSTTTEYHIQQPKQKDQALAPLEFVPEGFSMVTSTPQTGLTFTKSTLPLPLMAMPNCMSRIVIPCTVT